MPFCPKCRYEYIPGKTSCPDCDVELVDKLPEEPKNEWDPNEVVNLVTVAEFANYLEAEMVKLQLEDEGIYCYLANETVARTWRPTIGHVPSAGLASIEVQVKEEDVQRAMEVLNRPTLDIPEE